MNLHLRFRQVNSTVICVRGDQWKSFIKNELSGVCWERISELIEAVGWPQRPHEDLKQAFEKSTFIRIAYDRTHRSQSPLWERTFHRNPCYRVPSQVYPVEFSLLNISLGGLGTIYQQ